MQLYNADCLEILKELPDKCVDLLITDPPYEFQGGGSGGAFGRDKRNYHNEYLTVYHNEGHTEKAEGLRIIANARRNGGNISALANGFDFAILDECCRVMKKINAYIWCSKDQVGKLINYFTEKKCFIDIITWHKTNPIPTCNGTYLNDTEYCIFAREKGVKVYGEYKTKRKWYVSQCNKADKDKYHHPTIKPLDIIENLVINSSVGGGVILDCFMGSGTTGVACKKLGREFIGIEIDKTYFEIAKNRIDGVGEQIEMELQL